VTDHFSNHRDKIKDSQRPPIFFTTHHHISHAVHHVQTTGTSSRQGYNKTPLTNPQTLRPQAIQSRISHLLAHWPADPVRPASVSVHSYLQARLAEVDPTKQSQQQRTTAQTTQPPPSPDAQGLSESSLNALSSLLEDRYARRYPLSPRLRRPPSDPDYYDNLIREFEEAPSRDWWGRLGKRVKGLFRFT
jgi:hypothetical protein